MHRPLARIPLRSIAESFSHLHHGRRIVAERLDYSRTLTISTGRDVLWNGAESTTMNLQIQIVKALKLGKRGEASNLLLSLGQGNDVKGADDFLHILKYCAMSPDPLFVMEAWTIMDEKEISLNSLCSALMVEALCNGGYLEEALKLINFLKQSHGIYPVLHVYNTFLKACTKMQSMVYANQCLELMERQKVGKNEVTYALLLKLAVWQQNLSVARELWKDYIKHYSLSIIPLQKFLLSFSKLGDLKSACKTLQYMVALVISGKASVNKSIKGKLYSSRLDIPIPLNCELGLKKLNLEENEQSVPSRYCENLDGHVVSADQCTSFGLGIGETKSVPADGFNIDISTPVMELLRCSFTNLIYACAELRNGGLAEQLVLQMQKLGFQINSHVYDGLIRAIVPERGFSSGMEILKSMQQRNLKPYDRTLATLSIGCSKALELGLAETLLDQISVYSHPHAFNAFLAACDIRDQPENAVRLLAKMKHLQVTPNIWTYEQLFSLFGNVNAPYEEGNMLSQVDAAKRIKAIEMDMANYGIQHSFVSMNNLLKALGAEGMTRELIHYLHVAENLFCRNHIYLGTPIYNTVLHSLVESEESQMAIKMFKNMKSCGVPADAATYTIMIKCCKILRCYRSACALVSMMLRDGFYPLTITYTALIKTLLEDDIIDEALNLLDQASSEGNKLDTLVFNTILRKACEKELIDVVEFLVEWMHQEKIRPDSGTCSSVFTAYTNCGFYSTAMEALQVLSMRIICDEDGSCSEKTKFEDDYIFAEDEGAESRIILHFKDSKEDLAVALLNLRWCAVLGFPISWLPDQSPWAKRLSTNYTARIGAT
ncbi:putative pentatricopeptide [Rosa chinensis]|uniref:Putative pentatricopeptide n=2 Tax=Rosa chinensis TaxID=74649 RepID=A0A2P6PQS0_ROSCH|nr:pentatricopeptide repeat-containing protein At1g76280 isoform X1 [Rosa chinensis]XP_024163037.1 pentatricopeptide repeat-containing protein At1g76280 isoform X1 [Rosa chinensis]PRQ24262.1 putative pentatricopeptide [Rosa chinensis]